MQGIYRILNLATGKWYVGRSNDIGQRWKVHKSDLRKGSGSTHLQRAFNKYGAKNFILEILREVKGSREEVQAVEQEYLDEWMPTGLLYNLSPLAWGGRGRGFGWHHSKETKVKIGKGNSGKQRSDESRRQRSARMLSDQNHIRGKPWSDARRAGQRNARMGAGNPMYGKTHTDEWKQDQSEFMTGQAFGAKPYPALYNVKIGEFIPAGRNLRKVCLETGANYNSMLGVVGTRKTKQTRCGWRLASFEEIEIYNERLKLGFPNDFEPIITE